MNKKLILYILLTILCMVTIFCFSSKNTVESNGASKSIIRYSVGIYEKITKKEVNEEKVITKLNYPVRKLAHASEYLIFTLLIILVLRNCHIKFKISIVIALLICFVYACSDEYHQTFINGRTGQFFDVLVDTFGGFIGVLISSFIEFKKKKIKL